MPEFTTACPRNCYSTCGLTVRVEGGRLRGIEAHPDGAATSQGPCLKGLSYLERVYSPDRILHPLRRRSGGGFDRVSWDDALGEIAERLLRYRETPGPRSVLYYSASGTKGLLNGLGAEFWRLYGGATTTYGDLCWPAGLEATRLTLGANRHNLSWDIENAKLIVFWGKNAAETNVHQMLFVDRARAAGARVVVIDPRRTETADKADLLIQPRPGTDAALALAVANRVIESGNADEAFIAAHVHGYEEFRLRAAQYPPERAAEICEIPEGAIEKFARWLGEAEAATFCVGYGMQRYANSGQTLRCILGLPVITGHLGRPGTGWQFANLQTAIFDAVQDPVAFYPPAGGEATGDPLRVSISTARLGREMLETRAPELKMAWVERGNPLTSNPESNTVREAFRALEFRVVVDQFLTDTAREADIVLPAKSMFEQSDVIGAYWHPYIQLKQKAIEPPGEVKPESEIYRLLAGRLGLDAAAVAERFPGPTDGEVDAWLERRLAPFPALSLAGLRQGPILAPGQQAIAFADGVYPTPSGRIELLSLEAAERWGVDPLPDHVEPLESPRRDSPDLSGYPLQLLTPNTKNRIHSQFGNLAMIRAVAEGPCIAVHPADAAERGLREGDPARVFNSRGGFTMATRIDHGLRPGCIAVSNGWWEADGGSVNQCSLGRETDMGHGAAFHECRVQLERAE